MDHIRKYYYSERLCSHIHGILEYALLYYGDVTLRWQTSTEALL